METLIGLFKAECIRTTVFHHGRYRGIADAHLGALDRELQPL